MKKTDLDKSVEFIKSYTRLAVAKFERLDLDGFFRQNRRYFAWAALGLLGVFVLYIGYLYLVLTPKLAKADINTLLPISTQILDRNGKLLYEVNGEIKRTVIKSEDIPDVMKKATVFAEDRNFYRHFGIDPSGIGRAMVANFKAGGVVQGGSTITQQLVKNLVLDSERSLNRKLKEAILALMLETRTDKDQILTTYLNSVSYGSNLVGVNEASQTMFGKEPRDLTLSEAATLAALPKSPSYLSPYTGDREALVARRNFILGELKEHNQITEEEYRTALANVPKFQPFAQKVTAPHFSLLVRDQLIEAYGEEKVLAGGLVVKTTLDLDLQTEAEKLVAQHRRRINGWGASNVGAVIMDPKTGQVLAMVGSFDYNDDNIDGKVNTTLAPRQPGSSFKPVVYSALFENTKYSPASIIYDVKTNFGGYVPENYSKKNYGPLPIRRTLAGSLNIPAVKATSIVGVDKVVETAQKLGLSTFNGDNQFGLAVGLGAGEVKLVEMAAAFGTFPNGGSYTPPSTIMEIYEQSGEKIFESKPESREAIKPEVAYQISNILSDNEARSFIFGANSPLAFPGRTVGAKTGTTSWYKDAWTMGFTTSRVVGVWTGNNNGKIMRYGADGSFVAAPLWRALLTTSMKGLAYEEFKRPDNMKLVGGEYLASWQDASAGARLAQSSERPNNPAWEKAVQEYLKKKQEEEAKQAAANEIPVLTPEGAGGGEEPDVGGAPDEPEQEPEVPSDSSQPRSPNTVPETPPAQQTAVQ